MLVELLIENFRSIGEEQLFSMVATKLKGDNTKGLFLSPENDKISLLRTASIYGANASGKSNFVNALLALKFLILSSRKFDIDDNIPCYEPCKIIKERKKGPIKFVIEFISNSLIGSKSKMRYIYSLSFNKKKILLEELIAFKTSKKSNVFLRDRNNRVTWGSFFSKKHNYIESVINHNQLLLSVAGNTEGHPLGTIFSFFKDQLHIKSSDLSSLLMEHDYHFLSGENLRYIRNSIKTDASSNNIINLLNAADMGIKKISVKTSNREIKIDSLLEQGIPKDLAKTIQEDIKNRIITSHEIFKNNKPAGTVDFDLFEESNGTLRLLSLGKSIFQVLRSGGTLIVDEIETSLHPALSSFIFKLFTEFNLNPNNAQLIATTHDVTLLTPTLFRRDQVWFTQKDNQGQTHIYSLAEFKNSDVRKDTPYGDWYLNGRFGAIPTLNHLPMLSKCRKCGGCDA